MKYYSLQSGSNGNCFLIVTKDSKILIDVGINYSTIKERLDNIGYSIEDIDAILITHEHIDHIKSVRYFNFNKVYATKETLVGFNYHHILPYILFNINSTHIVPISISHDIRNGVGYVIDDEKQSLVYMTDTGKVFTKNYPYMKNANHYIIESNYNEEMLESCSRPDYLKLRIKSNKGHLSNVQSGKAMSKLIGKLTKSIMLAHISKDTNTNELALKEFKLQLDKANIDYSSINIKAASREGVTIGETSD